MKLLRLYISLFLCLVGHLMANSQMVYRLVDTEIGLPDDEVKAFFSCPDGRLGIRTSSSLSLFDGCTFRTFSPMSAKSYPVSNVSTLPRVYVDAAQRVWLKELGQILVFDLVREKYVEDVNALLNSMGIQVPIRDFFIDAAYDVWAVTASGKLWHRGHQIAVRTNGLRDICRYGYVEWLVYSDGYLLGMDVRTEKVIASTRLWKSTVLNRDFVRFAQKGNQLWLMWDHGVASWLPQQKIWKKCYEDGSHTFTTLAVTSDGKAFLAVRQQGLVTIDAMGKTSVQTSFPVVGGELLSDDIQSILYQNGNLLLGFNYKGIGLYNANLQGFPFYSYELYHAEAMGFYRTANTSNGKVILSFAGGNQVFNPYNNTLQPLLSGLEDNKDYIKSFTDSKGRVWIGTFRNGIYMKEGAKVSHFMQEATSQKNVDFNIVRNFAEDHLHRIWVCYHGGVGIFDERSKRIVPYRNSCLEGNSSINAILFDKKHQLWAATNKGLVVGSRFKLHQVCKVIAFDRRGYVWVGTLNGVFVIDPQKNRICRFGKEDGMSNEMIQDLIVDKWGNVWATTANGLCRFSVSHSSEKPFALTVFDGQNKLGDAKFLPQTAAQVASGNLFLGTATGFYLVNPTQVKTTRYTGHPIFTSLFVNNQEVEVGKEYSGRVILPQTLNAAQHVVLHHNENFISILFSGLNFDMPYHTYYKYRLQGMSNQWMEMSPQDGVGRVNYTNLAPGNYKLEVYSAGFDKIWSKRPAVLEIEILAPLWATWWAKLFYVLLFIALIVIGVRWKNEQNRKRMENEKYKELEEMKYRFFTNISHEFRTLLTLIITPIGTLLRRTADAETRAQLNEVSKNAGDLLQLVNQLLDFRKMEMNGDQLNLTSGNLDEFIKYTTLKFMPLSEQKRISLNFDDKTGGLFMCFDKDKIGKVLTNLLSNAFKFTDAGGQVKVELSKCILDSRHYAHIVVEDTGCGISKEEQSHVFERFYRAAQKQDATQVGSGIGLNMVYEYVRMHKGKISLESEVGKGSRFMVDIPVDLKSEVSVDRDETNENSARVTDGDADETLKNRGKDKKDKVDKCVMVVEDNDDFRHFLQRELSHIYNKVLTARDGMEGVLTAESDNPDIIVSDVMMPRMSGTDMCLRIKENIATSHIPIILLTAWSTDEGRAESYKVGADAYIAKPFDMEVLLARISNLLEKQEKRQRDFSHSISLDPKNVTDSTADEAFLSEIIGFIEKNIDNSEYTIDSLAADVVMSRMSLYRKMKALTGQTPADFIRTVRLKMAAKLLKAGICNVSEACYRTGFASPQNFSKHFKEMFGMVPSQYS